MNKQKKRSNKITAWVGVRLRVPAAAPFPMEASSEEPSRGENWEEAERRVEIDTL